MDETKPVAVETDSLNREEERCFYWEARGISESAFPTG